MMGVAGVLGAALCMVLVILTVSNKFLKFKFLLYFF
jgi:hypothetical protein